MNAVQTPAWCSNYRNATARRYAGRIAETNTSSCTQTSGGSQRAACVCAHGMGVTVAAGSPTIIKFAEHQLPVGLPAGLF
jgi:hypothetical protein